MAKKKPKKRKPVRAYTSATDIDPATGEDRRADAVTVAWMLAMLATAAADVLSAALFGFLPMFFEQTEGSELSPLVLARLVLLIAAVTGAVCVTLTPAVYRFRNEPPPIQITVFGLIASILPIFVLFWTAISTPSGDWNFMR